MYLPYHKRQRSWKMNKISNFLTMLTIIIPITENINTFAKLLNNSNLT